MNRRGVLGVASGLALSRASFKLFGRTPVGQGPQPRLKIGFLGAAYSHASSKLKLLQRHTDFELTGAWDDDRKVRERVAAMGVAVIPQDEVLSRSQIIAVESVVRTHAHLAHVALAAGRHVHLEKPPSLALQDFSELVQLAREKHLVLQVGYQYRYSPAFQAVVEAVRKGWLGQVFMVRATINKQLVEKRRIEWGEFKGGTMFELGSHMIDAIVRLLGRPTKVTPFLFTHGRFNDALKDNTMAVFEYPGAIASILSSTLHLNSDAYRSLEVLGTQGTAVIRPLEPPTLALDLAKAAGPYKVGMNNLAWPQWEQFVGDFADLATAVRGNGQTSVPLDEELAVQEALLLASGMA